MEAPAGANLPTDAELNMMAQDIRGPGVRAEFQNPPQPGGLEARQQAFEKGYKERV